MRTGAALMAETSAADSGSSSKIASNAEVSMITRGYLGRPLAS